MVGLSNRIKFSCPEVTATEMANACLVNLNSKVTYYCTLNVLLRFNLSMSMYSYYLRVI